MKKISYIAASLILLSAGKTAYSMKRNSENDGHSNRASQDPVPQSLLNKEFDLYKHLEKLKYGMSLSTLDHILQLRVKIIDVIRTQQYLCNAIESCTKPFLSEDEKDEVSKMIKVAIDWLEKKIDFIEKYKDESWTFFALPLHKQLEEMKAHFPEREGDLEEVLNDIRTHRFFREDDDVKVIPDKNGDIIRHLIDKKGLRKVCNIPIKMLEMKEELERINNEFWKTYVDITEFLMKKKREFSIESNAERSTQHPPHIQGAPFISGQRVQQEAVQSLSNNIEKISHGASVEQVGLQSHKKNSEPKEEKKERSIERKKDIEPPLTKSVKEVQKHEEIEKNIMGLRNRMIELIKEKERIFRELHKTVWTLEEEKEKEETLQWVAYIAETALQILSDEEILQIKKLETVFHEEPKNADKIIKDVQKIKHDPRIHYTQHKLIRDILDKITKFIDDRDILKNCYEKEGEQIEKVSLKNSELCEKWKALGAEIQKDLFDAPRKSVPHMGSAQKKIYRAQLAALEELQNICTSIPSFKTGDEFFYEILNPSVDLAKEVQQTQEVLKNISSSVNQFISKKETKNNVLDVIERISRKLYDFVLLEKDMFGKTLFTIHGPLDRYSPLMRRTDKESIEKNMSCFCMVKNNKKEQLSKIEKEFKVKNNKLKRDFDVFLTYIKYFRNKIEQNMLPEQICKEVESVTEDSATFASGQIEKVKKHEEMEKNIMELQKRTIKLMRKKERIFQELDNIVPTLEKDRIPDEEQSDPPTRLLSDDEIVQIKKLGTVFHEEPNNADKIIGDAGKIRYDKSIDDTQRWVIRDILDEITKFIDGRRALKNFYEQEGERVSLDNPELHEKWKALGEEIHTGLFAASREDARHIMGSAQKIYDIDMFRELLSDLEKLQNACRSIPSFEKTGDKFFYEILNPSIDLAKELEQTKEVLRNIEPSVKEFIAEKKTKNKVLRLMDKIFFAVRDRVSLEKNTFLDVLFKIRGHPDRDKSLKRRKDEKFIEENLFCFRVVKNKEKKELSEIEKEFKEENNKLQRELDVFITYIQCLRKEIEQNMRLDPISKEVKSIAKLEQSMHLEAICKGMESVAEDMLLEAIWKELESVTELEQSMLPEPISKEVESVTKDKTPFVSGQTPQQEVVQSLSNDIEKISYGASVEQVGWQSHKKNSKQEEEKKESSIERKKYIAPPVTKNLQEVQKHEEMEKNIMELYKRTIELMREKERIRRWLDYIIPTLKTLSHDDVVGIKTLETVLHVETNNADKIIQDVQKIENDTRVHYRQRMVIGDILNKITKFIDARDILKNDYEQEGGQMEKVFLYNSELREKWKALGPEIHKGIFAASRESARFMGSAQKIYEIGMLRELLSDLEKLQNACTSIPCFEKKGDKFFCEILNPSVDLDKEREQTQEVLRNIRSSVQEFISKKETKNNVLKLMDNISQAVTDRVCLEEHAFFDILFRIHGHLDRDNPLWDRKDKKSIKKNILCFCKVKNNKKEELSKIEERFAVRKKTLKGDLDGFITRIKSFRNKIEQDMLPEAISKEVESVTEDEATFASGQIPQQEVVQSNDIEKISHGASVEQVGCQSHKKNSEQEEEKKETSIETKKDIEPPPAKKTKNKKKKKRKKKNKAEKE